MPERDRVLDAFRNCITEPKCKDCPWTECETIGHGPIEIPRDLALAVMRELVAQEPRVMTLEKVLGAEVNVDQCWLEVNGVERVYLADAVVCPEHLERADIQRWGASDCQLPLDLYGSYWRMWTRKPTDEQREAIPWLT